MHKIVVGCFIAAMLAGCTSSSEDEPGTPQPVDAPGFSVPTVIQESTGREMSLAVDPNNDARLLACSPTGTGVVGTGANHSDFWLSLDAGANWTRLAVEDGAALPDLRGFTNEGGDCDVAIAPDGTLWTVDSWLGSLAVSHSADGTAWVGNALSAMIPVADRPWIRFDAAGRLHMTYQDVQALNPSLIWYTSTTDGASWSVPTSVTTATADGLFTWTGDFVISDDGQHLWSIYTRRQSLVISDPAEGGPEQVWIAHSSDGGASWSSRLLSQRAGPSSFLYASLDMDEAGGLHAVWSEARANDQPTFYAHAADATTWSEPVSLQDGLRTGAPWIAAGVEGVAHALWSGSPDPAGEEQRWWFYTAAIINGTWTVQTTTEEPLWVGPQPLFPEFNEIMLDSLGQPQIAAVAPCETDAGNTLWCPYFQRFS